MDVKIPPRWRDRLEFEFEKPYFEKLEAFVQEEYRRHQCFPPEDQVFSALWHTPFKQVKVVIIGQDPYHGTGQANGLCFSVNEGVAVPPSLRNIFEEIKRDLGSEIPSSGNLERWARQGVLLLNATLSVRAHQAGSHQNKGWEQFTDAIITTLSQEREGIVFLLWGGYAKRKGKKIDAERHLVLTSGHPSPLSANRGYWFGNRHFSKTNAYLQKKGKDPIIW